MGQLVAASAQVTGCPCQQLGEPRAASVAQAHLVPCRVLQHLISSHCIPPRPSAFHCSVSKGELIYSFQLCWSRGKTLPS